MANSHGWVRVRTEPAVFPVGGVTAYSTFVIDPDDLAKDFVHCQNLALKGWLLCNGARVRIAKFQELYLAIRNRYDAGAGSVDGSSNQAKGFFNLPDYRGQFLRGQNLQRESNGTPFDPGVGDRVDAAGKGPGDAPGTTEDMMVQSHSHAYLQAQIAAAGAGDVTGAASLVTQTDYLTIGLYEPVQSHIPSGSGEKLSGKETRPRNIYVNFLIRYTNDPGHIVAIGPSEIKPPEN